MTAKYTKSVAIVLEKDELLQHLSKEEIEEKLMGFDPEFMGGYNLYGIPANENDVLNAARKFYFVTKLKGALYRSAEMIF